MRGDPSGGGRSRASHQTIRLDVGKDERKAVPESRALCFLGVTFTIAALLSLLTCQAVRALSLAACSPRRRGRSALFDVLAVYKGLAIGADFALALPYAELVFMRDKAWARRHSLSDAICSGPASSRHRVG